MAETDPVWVVQLKALAISARERAEDQRFGQFLYNAIRSMPNFPDTGPDARLEEQYVGEKLWTMEGDQLSKAIDNFLKKA